MLLEIAGPAVTVAAYPRTGVRLNVDMTEPEIDGGVIADAELATLARRTAAELRDRFTDLDPALGKQLAAVATVLDALALRLVSSPPADPPPLADLALALDDGDLDAALIVARRAVSAERDRLPDPDWDLFA